MKPLEGSRCSRGSCHSRRRTHSPAWTCRRGSGDARTAVVGLTTAAPCPGSRRIARDSVAPGLRQPVVFRLATEDAISEAAVVTLCRQLSAGRFASGNSACYVSPGTGVFLRRIGGAYVIDPVHCHQSPASTFRLKAPRICKRTWEWTTSSSNNRSSTRHMRIPPVIGSWTRRDSRRRRS